MCLVLLTLQSASVTLVSRYAKSRDGPKFFDSTAVLLCELIKLLLSVAIMCYESGGVVSGIHSLYRNIFTDPWDLLRVSPTAFLYFVQNQLVYVSITNLDAATHLVFKFMCLL